MPGALLLASITSACGSSEPSEAGSLEPGADPSDPVAESPLAIKDTFPPDKRRDLGASPPLPREPLECSDIFAHETCKKYGIQLLGNPSTDLALQAKYKAAFGSACYVAAANDAFVCFYKDPLKACEDGVRVPDIYGAAAYDKTYKCLEVKGTMDWWRQVGPDPTIKIDIKYGDAPLETSLIDVDGVPTAINGPYRNLPEPPKVKVGGSFWCASGQVDAKGNSIVQRTRILEVNKKAHGDVIHSDLAGFMWPCNEKDKPICIEETELFEGSPDRATAPQVHHEVRATDLRGCKWGTNSNKNAVVISAKLNGYLHNKYPTKAEVEQINKLAPYTP